MANAVCWAIQNGNWSSASTWANGVIPDTSGTDLVYTNGFTINVDTNVNVALLSNAAVAAQNTRLNPVMTSNTSPSGVVTASSFSGGQVPWYAFNGSTGGSNQWISNGAVPQWIQYQFTSAVLIRSYSIFYSVASSGRPVNFNLQGSNDGSSWTTLDTRIGFVFTNGQYNNFTISNPTTA